MVKFTEQESNFDDALSHLASLHAQELGRVQSELQSRIASLEASLLEAEALKTAAAEPETLAAVVADLAEELQQRDSDEGDGRPVVTFRSSELHPTMPSHRNTQRILECQKNVLQSHMSHMARTKLRKMQQEITRKEQAIGELHARVSGKDLRLPKAKVTLSSMLNSRCFGLCVGSMIIFNSILLGMEVNRNKPWLQEQFLTVLGEICNVFFLLELLLRLWCYRLLFFTGDEQGWNIFDAFLVLSSALDVVLTYTVSESTTLRGGVRMLKLFRIMRLFRVFRFSRQLANWALMILESLKSLFGALILLGIIIYVFAVSLSMNTADWLMQEEGSPELRHDVEIWFGSLGRTLYTLLLSILGGLSWHLVCDLLLQIDLLSAGLLLLYIMLTIFSVLNVITGVFVDSAIQSSNSQRDIQIEREMEVKEAFIQSLKDFFEALDTDASGSIHLEEIKIMLQDPTLRAYFAVLGFDEVNANQIFHLLDDDESGEVSIEEFLEGCSKLKGHARSIDVHALMRQCRALHRELSFVATNLGVDMQSSAAMAIR